MNTKETGGAAFPSGSRDGTESAGYGTSAIRKIQTPIHNGMTLRDYFAAKTMQGMVANPDCNLASGELVITAYEIADMMLAERQK